MAKARMQTTVLPGPIPSPILAQIRAILRKDAAADRIALLWPEPIDLGDSAGVFEQFGDTRLRFVYCPSPLAMREHLVRHGDGDAVSSETGGKDRERLVMLSPFDETRLGKDVLARLWSHEPKRISPWRTLEQLLRVRQIDPRLTGKGYRWIAECLVSNYDRYQAGIQFGGILDFDKAWQALALGLLDYRAESVDLDALLEWSRGTGSGDAVAALPEQVQLHLGDWLEPRLGKQAELVQALWRKGHAGDMVAIGLVCSLIYPQIPPNLPFAKGGTDGAMGGSHPPLKKGGRGGFQEILQARGRFTERFLGDAKIELPILQAFGSATVAYLGRRLKDGGYAAFADSFAVAEQALASIDLLPLAEHSDLLPVAFELRLERFAAALKRETGAKSNAASKAVLLDALTALRNHPLTGLRREQLRRAELAVRATFWLQTEESGAPSARAIIGDYIDNGGWLDWARSAIWSGDEHEALSQVYQQLSKKIGARRERLNQQFSEQLATIARGDQLGDDVIPVEATLDRLLTPLASQQPMLLLVLDGMSQAVYRELSGDLLRRNWVEMQREAAQRSVCLLAALPTVTRISRFSLLSGSLGEGVGSDEKKAFSAHAGLKKSASTKYPPVLFHKADLQQVGSGALADSVREVIAGQRHKVVAAVINAIDDQLSSGAQLSVNWSVESVSLLRQILEAAREGGRLLVVTSDHGHVLDHDMRYTKAATEAERYKPATEKVSSGEVLVSGARVVQPGQKVILPWSEKIRYASKRMGYHGGGSPQEVIIPLGVYRNAGETDTVDGWREVPRREPDWWRLRAAEPTVIDEAPKSPVKTRKKPKKDLLTPDLFAAIPLEANLAASASPANWIAALPNSPVYTQMKSRAGRVVLDEQKLQQLLSLLADQGGQQMVAALAQALGIPSIRMNGFLAGAQKLLNVDGYPVLSIDRASKTVKLNIDSLKTQFEL